MEHRREVVMGVDVDKAWCQREPRRIDFSARRVGHRTYFGDAIAIDSDVGYEGSAAVAVVDGCVAVDRVKPNSPSVARR